MGPERVTLGVKSALILAAAPRWARPADAPCPPVPFHPRPGVHA